MKFSDFELFWAEDANLPQNWSILEHRHNNYHLFYMASGEAVFRSAEQTIPAAESTCLLFPPNVMHEMVATNNSCHLMELKFSLSNDLVNKKLEGRFHVLPGNTFLETSVEYINRCWLSGDKENIRTISCFLEAILRYIIACEEKQKECPNAVFAASDRYNSLSRKVISYVNLNFKKQISLSTMADALKYNKCYLSDAFSSETGINITSYISFVRIMNAVEALYYNPSDIKTIAEYMGFHSVGYFNRKFKQLLGITPSALQAAFSDRRSGTEPIRKMAESVFSSQSDDIHESKQKLLDLVAMVKDRKMP